jgi:hypothetical protein
MRQVKLSAENKKLSPLDYPKLKLDRNQTARILCIEDPIAGYVHTLRAPVVVNGVPKMTTAKGRDNAEYETYAMDFIGRPICLGDEGILDDKGVDPKNCPACKLSAESDMVKPPERRFAMHVIRYAIRAASGSFEVAAPFSVSVVAWSFPDMIFNKLADIATEWGDLRQHDLLLGPCTNVDFQKFDIAVSKHAAWMEPDSDGVKRGELVARTFQENKSDDLSVFTGRKVDQAFLREDLAKIEGRWRQVNNPGSATDGTEAAGQLTSGLNDLLNDPLAGHPGGLAEFSPAQTSTADLSSLLADNAPQAAVTRSAPTGETLNLAQMMENNQPAQAAQPVPAAAEAPDFSTILANLGKS